MRYADDAVVCFERQRDRFDQNYGWLQSSRRPSMAKFSLSAMAEEKSWSIWAKLCSMTMRWEPDDSGKFGPSLQASDFYWASDHARIRTTVDGSGGGRNKGEIGEFWPCAR